MVGRQERSEWRARRGLSVLVRASAVLTPVVVSVLATILVTHLVPRPGSGLAVVGWWVVLTGFATVIAMLAERVTRRLLPLSALFRLTLVFPDHAPKRYRVALRTGTSRQLAKRVATAHRDGLGETPQEAAEHVVELLAALNAHDRITRGHCERVRAYTDLLARELKLSPEDTSRLHWAGMIHDIGKLEVPAEILNKPGRLTDEEYEIVKRHPEAGARLAAPLADWLGEWRHAIDQHHERWDGRGYPAGLAGEQISLAGRIVAVADVFDVITAARSYKKPSSAVDARCELARCAGTQFDPAVVRAFLNISLGRLRMLVGPLSWLADLPVLGRVPLAPAGAAISAAASMSFFFVSLLLPGQPARASEAPPVPARAVAAAAPAPPAPVAATAPIDGPVASAPVAELLRPPLSDPVLPILPVTPSPAAPIPPAAAPDAPVPSPPTSPPPTVPPVDVPPVDDPPPPPPPTIPPPPPPPPTPPAPPVPAADVATTPQDTAVAIDVMANDAASTGALDPASVVVTAGPAHGTASANGDGSVTYLPTAGYVGTDSFTYTVCDGAACAVGTVTVDVVSVPVLANDSASTTPTAPVVIDVLANDSGALGSLDLATLHVVSGPSSGVATVNVDHTITYTPSSGFSGSDLLVYAVCDVGGGCAVSSATITVSPLAMPTVVPDAFTVAGPVTVDVLANDSGGSGVLDPTSLAIVAAPAAGNAVINVDHTITYTPSGPFASDSFTYQVCDTGGGCAFASVTLSAAAVPAPLTAADTASTAEATPVSIDVLANDSGGTGTLDPTTLAIASAPGSGTTAVVSGQVQYTPHAGFAGTDIFGYQVCDVGGSCAVASVTVTVVNVAPGAADDSALTVKNAAVVIDVLGNDGGDTDIDPSTLTITSAPGIGVVSVSVDRTVTYTPNHDTKGTDTFGYQVCDSHGACSTATVTVTILDADKAPVLGKDFASTLSLLPVTVDVLANDTDPDDQIVPSTLFIKSAPKHGTAVVNPDHTITYTPNLLFIGKDTFKYSVCDSLGTCSEADIEVTVV